MWRGYALSLCLALAVGCGPGWDQYNAKVNELKKVQQELAEKTQKWEAEGTSMADAIRILKAHNERLKGRLLALGQDISKLEAERGSMAVGLAAAKKRMEEMKRKQQQAEARLAQFRSLLSKFKKMIDAGQLQVAVRNGKMTVKLPESILFPSGKASLKREGKTALAQVATILSQIPNRSFQVAGHTDNVPIRRGKYRDNWHLSTARALEVVQVMIQNGMAPNRVSAAGFADTDPVVSNDDPAGRAQNRRIEIVLLPNIEELPSLDDLLKTQ